MNTFHLIKDLFFIIIILILLFILIKNQILTPFPQSNNIFSSDKEKLYQRNSELMNKFLIFKDLEAHNLKTEISIKDRLFKHFFDFSPDAFVIFNDNNISYFNDAFSHLIGIKDRQAFSQKNIWQFIHTDYISKVQKSYNLLLKGTIDVSIHSLKILTLDNKIKEVKMSSNIVFFEDSYYILSCIHDLSAHNEQERIKLELKNNIKDEKFKVECFANISHDIKTPINVIYSAVQLQEMYTEANDYDKILVSNNIIKQNCLRLQKLLNDVLDITKFDAKHFKPNLELCNIIHCIEYTTQSVTSFIEQNDITIIFDTNVEDKFVMTDLNFIERIILNLISNAIKYGKEKGHVWVNLHDTGDHLIICIKDDGIGIAKEQIPTIFRRFQKTNQPAAKRVSSNGIGLSLVKSMVETLGGTISCLSTEGVGSEFIVILPMASLEADGNDSYQYPTSLDLTTQLKVELSDI